MISGRWDPENPRGQTHLERQIPSQGKTAPSKRTVLPLRIVETITESKADRDKAQRDLFTRHSHDSQWRNMLIWGDNNLVMSSLLPRFVGKINLIYIDPPFAAGHDFSFRTRIGHEPPLNHPIIIEQKAYRDTWGRGLDSYLQMILERLTLVRELLPEDGSIYVHLGPGIAHYVKVAMDELFGHDCYRNEIIWKRDVAGKGAKRASSQWPRNADHILLYSKSPEQWFFRQQYRELNERQKRVYRYSEPDGRVRRDEYLNFILANPEYLPDKARDMTVKFTDYIDHWAVDWDYPADGRDTFHNRWQSFRTRRTPKLHTKATHTHQTPGARKVLGKVVDIFANETTKLLEVNVK